MFDNSPPPWIDAPWWEVYGARLRAADLTQQAWIDALAQAWCLIRRREALTAWQLADEEDMVDRLLGRKFLTTRPSGPSADRSERKDSWA